MLQLEKRLDATHAWARHCPLLQRFTVFTRLLLGIGFIAPGLTKLLGNRFTLLSIDSPVGFFFEALYRTGFYWRFIGFAQVLASLLVLIPRTATLGAVCFFPLILNIFIITVSMNFAGTPFVTGLMLLANLYLLCWDYHKLKPLFLSSTAAVPRFTEVAPHWIERVGYSVCIVTGLLLSLSTRGLFQPGSRAVFLGLFLLGLLGGLLILTGWIVLTRKHWPTRRATV
jgi:uncharacterized membrane protein YphA (DoxX/SURF4 family)